MNLRNHVKNAVICAREGHPSFKAKREVRNIGGGGRLDRGEWVSYLICTRCGSGVDPRPVKKEDA